MHGWHLKKWLCPLMSCHVILRFWICAMRTVWRRTSSTLTDTRALSTASLTSTGTTIPSTALSTSTGRISLSTVFSTSTDRTSLSTAFSTSTVKNLFSTAPKFFFDCHPRTFNYILNFNWTFNCIFNLLTYEHILLNGVKIFPKYTQNSFALVHNIALP